MSPGAITLIVILGILLIVGYKFWLEHKREMAKINKK